MHAQTGAHNARTHRRTQSTHTQTHTKYAHTGAYNARTHRRTQRTHTQVHTSRNQHTSGTTIRFELFLMMSASYLLFLQKGNLAHCFNHPLVSSRDSLPGS